MLKIHVPLGGGYDVIIGHGLTEQAGRLLKPVLPGSLAAIVCDDTTRELFLEPLKASLNGAGIRTVEYAFPHGEQHKTLGTLGELLSFFARNGLTRADAAIALGGGVTGDMTGFAAAVYQRGIPFVQVPTTLLSAVDASVGGKTAVDLPEGKNLAGAFHQPLAVLCDADTFATLPPETLRDGMAEAVKMGVLFDRSYFASLSNGIPEDLVPVVARSVELKRDVVLRDEFDRGERALLNLGHTFAHAIEKCMDFQMTHGHAVAVGTVMAARASEALGVAEEPVLDPVRAAMEANGLPVKADLPADRMLEAMLRDKKRAGAQITLVLPERIGKARLHPVGVGDLRGILEAAT